MPRFEIEDRTGGAPYPVNAAHWQQALKAWLVARGRSDDTSQFSFDLQEDGTVVVRASSGEHPIRIRPLVPGGARRARVSTAPPPVPSDELTDPFDELPTPEVEPTRRPQRARSARAIAAEPTSLEARTTRFSGAVDAACAQLLDACLDAFPSSAGSVFLIDARERALYFAVVRGPQADALRHRRLPLEVGLVGASIRSRRSINLNQPADDPRFARSLAASIGWTPKSLVCAPILDGRRVFGAVELLDRDGGYSDEDEARIRRAARRLGHYLASA